MTKTLKRLTALAALAMLACPFALADGPTNEAAPSEGVGDWLAALYHWLCDLLGLCSHEPNGFHPDEIMRGVPELNP